MTTILEEAPVAPGQAPQQRRDRPRSAILSRAIVIQRDFNTLCALEYLKPHGIAAHTIERVLLTPALRPAAPSGDGELAERWR